MSSKLTISSSFCAMIEISERVRKHLVVSSKYCFHRNRVNRIFKVFLCCIAPAIVSKFGSQLKALSYTERMDVYLGHLSFQFSLSCSIHANLIHANLIHANLIHLVLCRLFMNSISLKELRNAALWFISGFFCLLPYFTSKLSSRKVKCGKVMWTSSRR